MSELVAESAAVEAAFTQFIQSLTDIQDTVQDKLLRFKQRQIETETKVASCRSSTRKVSLDVGGTVFTTTEDTLLKQRDSFFGAMLSSGQWLPDENTGQYFIDRSPKMFGMIIDYLRDDTIWGADKLSPQEKQHLQNELDFYQISITVPLLYWDTGAITGSCSLKFSPDKQTLRILGGSPTMRLVGGHLVTLKASVCTVPFWPGDLNFTLEVSAMSNTEFGSPHLRLLANQQEVQFSLGLLDGIATAATGEDVILFHRVTCNGIVKKYTFTYNADSSQLTVTWPTGDKRTEFVPGPLYCAQLGNLTHTTSATFYLTG
eukprot:TRINITY_DN67088_c3_g1_i1.p2 TRINITY_DN67088_c3_g1~~TRINITY_DN67088_c3_g1_i1.p2  ORF type:complete len:317 (+),score=45.51 TRINITY_DN67088_c3_g1_i1:54-1004(+)